MTSRLNDDTPRITLRDPCESPCDAKIDEIALAASMPGAILIRKPSRTRAGHVAISAGAGETIEAYSSSRGVIRHKAFSTGRVWHRACFLPGIDYSGDLEAG